MRPRKPIDLKEACLSEALAIIEEEGVERLSIREVARRLGVSHQAPYKHFPSSDHLLAELVRRSYIDFAQHLEDRARAKSSDDAMRHMGEAYFRFAMEHPLKYRLLFGTPLPDPQQHPAMMLEARKAFTLLLEGVALKKGASSVSTDLSAHHLDAIFVWAVVHGMASIMQFPVLRELGLKQSTLRAAMPHALQGIGRALASIGTEEPTAKALPAPLASQPPARKRT